MSEETQETTAGTVGIYIAKMRPSLKGTLYFGKDAQGKTIRKKFFFVNGSLTLTDPKEIAELDRQLTGVLGQHVMKVNPEHAARMADEYNKKRLAQTSAVTGVFTSEDSVSGRQAARVNELMGSENPQTDPKLAEEMAAKIEADTGMQATIPQDLSAKTAADDAAIAAVQEAKKAAAEVPKSATVGEAFKALKKE